jgi:WD40 repeat protein
MFETAGYSEVVRDVEYGDVCYWVEFDKAGRLVTASVDGFVRLYDSHFQLLAKAKTAGGEKPFSARFSPDGKRIAVGFYEGTAVDIVSGADLSLEYPLKVPSGAGTLSAALWSADGQQVCAAGRYALDSVHPVLCWDKQGKGKQSSFPVAGNSVLEITALRDEAIAFCSFDGEVGVLNGGGSMAWRSVPDFMDYRGGPSFPRLSADGDKVEAASYFFDGTTWTRHPVRFSISGQKAEIDSAADSSLAGPVTSDLTVADWHDNYHPTLNGRPLTIDTYEISRSLAIAPGKDSFVLGTEWYLRRFDKQGKQGWQTTVPGTVWGVNISSDGRFVVALLGDGTIRWYTFEEGREVLAVFIDRDLKRWVAWNPDGFFTFQGGGDGLIGYQINRGSAHEGDFVKVDQLREVFNQPDLIAQILKPEGEAALVAARSRIGEIAKILGGGLPPEIELISAPEATVAGDYLLQFRIKDMGGGHGRIVYRIDGAEIEGRAAIDIRGTTGDTNSRYLPIAGGEHTVSVAVYDRAGKIEGAAKVIRVTRTVPALGSGANLYVVAAGISHYLDNSLSAGVNSRLPMPI